MDTAPPSAKPSLWRDGIRRFEQSWREWMRLATIFFFITAFFHMLSAYLLQPYQPQLTALKGQKDIHVVLATVRDMGPVFITLAGLMFVLTTAQKYVFLSFFMHKEMPAATTQPTVQNYFFFLGKVIQLGFTILAPVMLVGMIGGVLSFTKLLPSALLTLVNVFLILGVLFYFGIRLSLTTSLAAAGLQAPIKNSWALTRDQCWRLALNGLMLVLLFIALSLLIIVFTILITFLISLILGAVQQSQIAHQMAIFVVKPVVSGLVQTLVSGVVCAYMCTATRILYQEKQAADSAFKLVSSS